mmetsp:Transcript_5229/g.14824  ORF Transcript_5229/g.14824 Transcript_5229/m.14824 type:complete len:782 (-) Transcript_5229:2365-4710(-)|eukprot:CAMPEP_0181030750 /NCGR_PEP_ID=MMETSP1070-20121207/5883_1 /TAXON_ID=265543 /ORGANISM="Minutocellus polymorphus, Strain NH13" /LENGTH=781 /DNA_ID=CAMNT_0023108117 /DNA_START=124 /DNA_END=2469 /DNA_ORIENTATION=-
MSLLRCPGASALGWDAPQEEDDEREKRKVESSGERKEVKSKTQRKSQSVSGKTDEEDGGHEIETISLGSKKRRMNEQNESPRGDEHSKEDEQTANDRNDANADADSPTAKDEESEAVGGESAANSNEDSATKDTEHAMETSNSVTDAALADSSAIVTFTPPGSEIVVTGMATITVLEGQVEIMGCTVDCMDESPSVQIYSPDGGWASAFTIVDVSAAGANSDESMSVSARRTRIRVDSLSWDGSETSVASKTFRITQRSDVRSALIIAERWRTTADVVISDLSRPICAGKKDENGLPDPSRVFVCGAKGVGKSTYVRYLLNKVMSCGQAGNNSVRKKRRVAVLDCDVGQPELGPPGLITLTVLEKPLLSPPHAHMVCGGSEEDDSVDGGHPSFAPSSGHAYARFFGHISAKADPSSYTAAIAGLVRKYEELVEKELERNSVEVGEDDQLSRLDVLPLVVNTAGWVKGMGFEILSSIVDVVRPGHIVQIVGAARAKFFDLTPHAFDGRSIHVVEAFGSVSRLPTDQEATPPPSRAVSPVPPSAEGSRQSGARRDTLQSTLGNSASVSTSSASTGTLRALRLSSYFLGGYKYLLESGAKFWPATGGIYDPLCSVASTLAAMRPYCVPFHSVFCSVPSLMEYRGTAQADELILKSLNGSIVGLCHWRGATHKEDARNQYGSTVRVQTTPPHLNASLLPCMGLGIVRGIDNVKQCFYILTPIASDPLMETPPNVLVRGLLQLPLTCTYRGVHSETLPHQNCDGISSGIGDDIMKSKNAPAKPAAR